MDHKGNIEKAFGMSIGILLGDILSEHFFPNRISLLPAEGSPDLADLLLSFAVSFAVSFLLFDLMDLFGEHSA